MFVYSSAYTATILILTVSHYHMWPENANGFFCHDAEIKQIMINDRLIGLIGLDATIKQAAKSQRSKDDCQLWSDGLTGSCH